MSYKSATMVRQLVAEVKKIAMLIEDKGTTIFANHSI